MALVEPEPVLSLTGHVIKGELVVAKLYCGFVNSTRYICSLGP